MERAGETLPLTLALSLSVYGEGGVSSAPDTIRSLVPESSLNC